MTDLSDLTIETAAALFRSRALSPVELTEALLRRIGAVDDALHAFIVVMADAALASARGAERDFAQGIDRGPLQGIPCAIKDNIDMEGVATTCHSRVRQDHVAGSDAFAVRQLRKAGAVIIGKASLHEFARGGSMWDLPWPPARNPWDVLRHPGGSSSGSATAVAAGLALAALGTDTGGSVRHPASACGLVGMKPTYGLVSRQGVFPVSFSLDAVGPLTRTPIDNAMVLMAIAGRDPVDLTSLRSKPGDCLLHIKDGVRGLRIGVIEHFHTEDVAADVELTDAFANAVGVLERLGAHVAPARIAPLQTWTACGNTILLAESYAVHKEWLLTRAGEYSPASRGKFLSGAFMPASRYIEAQQMRTVLRRGLDDTFRDVDALVAISSIRPPCIMDDPEEVRRTYDQGARFPFSVAGTPAISVPIGFTKGGLPIGMQIAAKGLAEPLLYRIAWAFCDHTRWTDRRPDASGWDQARRIVAH